MNILVMNIRREWFREILSIPPRKKIEYRQNKDYWKRRLEKVGKPPFMLRLLNGMIKPVPEAILLVERVTYSMDKTEIRLHLGKVLLVKHWNRKKETIK